VRTTVASTNASPAILREEMLSRMSSAGPIDRLFEELRFHCREGGNPD
jgi:hypothetical protein